MRKTVKLDRAHTLLFQGARKVIADAQERAEAEAARTRERLAVIEEGAKRHWLESMSALSEAHGLEGEFEWTTGEDGLVSLSWGKDDGAPAAPVPVTVS